MSRIYIFFLITCIIAMTLGYPLDNRQEDKDVLLVRLVRSADPVYGHRGGYYGGHRGGYGGFGGPVYPGGGGSSFSQSSANAAAISTPFGSASFSNSNANAGSFGR